MTKQGDTDPKQLQQQSHDDRALRLQRASAAQQQQNRADLNAAAPQVQYDSRGRRFYDTAPRPLRRLLGSPLAQSGKFARGPSRERQIGGAWGDRRNFSYDRNNPAVSIHQGLDYSAPLGEPILASADGVVTFAGYGKKSGSEQLNGAMADGSQNVLNENGQLVAARAQVGHGGIYVVITHNGDFANYQTSYMHMSRIFAKKGDRVAEGQVIGFVGSTGSSATPHLHFQVAYLAGKSTVVVNPTAMVPNFKPGGTDSTNSIAARGVLLPPLATAGTQVAAGQAANTINSLNRATTMQNQGVTELRQGQADHASRLAQTIDVQQTAQYAAEAGFQGSAPVVSAPMVFDFSKGTWSDGKVT